MKKPELENVAAAIDQRITEMLDRRNAELDALAERKAAAVERLAQIQQDISAATERLDADAYKAGRAAERDLKLEIQMLGDRWEQLHGEEFCSETESDAVIDELLQYERGLDSQYTDELKELLRQLDVVQRKYRGAVSEAERVITRWTARIHPNYRDQGKRKDRATPVHVVTYRGCIASNVLNDLFDNRHIVAILDDGQQID